jgi:FkbM family methyltransferase
LEIEKTVDMNGLDAEVVDKSFSDIDSSYSTALEDFEIDSDTLIKIDVDGGEYSVLQALEERLSDSKPVIFLEVHSDEIHQKCRDLL